MVTTNSSKKILLLPTAKGIQIIDINTIVRVKALSNYSKLYFSDGKTLVVAKLLHWFETALAKYEEQDYCTIFIRPHRTHLVNKNFIQSYHLGKIRLQNAELIEVSRRQKAHFLKCLFEAA